MARLDYFYLPKKFKKRHDYCEFVINQIEDLVLNKEFKELKEQSVTLTEEFIKQSDFEKNHIFDLLETGNFHDELNHIVRTQLIHSLIIETCYFVQESLLASLKMRMTVCFTLLRKPFLEISIILMRILNEEDFIDKFNNLANFDSIKTSPEQKKALIKKTNDWLHEKFPEEDIFNSIFDKNTADSLFNLTNNAIHLYTDRNPISATEKQNLNFIFSTRENVDSQWEYIYETIPMILTFLAETIELLVFKCTSVEEATFNRRIKARDMLREKNNVS